MKLSIEIGDAEQKEQISKEVRGVLESQMEVEESSGLIEKVLIPQDYDKAIKDLVNSEDFKSQREEIGQLAMGKTIKTNEGFTIVFSPFFYTKDFDLQIRCIYYFHELYHAINYESLPGQFNKANKDNELKALLNDLYDDYYANRAGLELTRDLFEDKTDLYLNHVKTVPKGHIDNITDNSNYYRKIAEINKQFKFGHLNMEQFYPKVRQLLRPASLEFIYAFSYIDTFDFLSNLESEFKSAKLYTENTQNLINYFREKYEKRDLDLSDGLDFAEQYLANFGLKLEDRPDGVYFEVQFI